MILSNGIEILDSDFIPKGFIIVKKENEYLCIDIREGEHTKTFSIPRGVDLTIPLKYGDEIKEWRFLGCSL
jgi:hypothetical protein